MWLARMMCVCLVWVERTRKLQGVYVGSSIHVDWEMNALKKFYGTSAIKILWHHPSFLPPVMHATNATCDTACSMHEFLFQIAIKLIVWVDVACHVWSTWLRFRWRVQETAQVQVEQDA
jgi:hypothetical protein